MTIGNHKTADVIVIGGGVAGMSTAMQLSLRGAKVLVLERAGLGSGSTGRAAGLLGQLRSTKSATQMLMDAVKIVKELEERVGVKIFYQTGSLRVAQTPERVQEIRDHVAMGQSIGFDIEHISLNRCRELLPYMRTDDLLDACYCPTDGHLQPAELLAAYTKVARQNGVTIKTNCPIEKVLIDRGRVEGVKADGEYYSSPVVLNATGPWSYLVAGLAETSIPTVAIGHFYLTTKPNPNVAISRESPAIRDRELRIYSRPESDGLIVGMYEAEPDLHEMEKLPADFDMTAMPIARDNLHVALLIHTAGQRFPFINERTPMTITTGIMTFTPDCKPICGAMPDVQGLYHCAGFCGHGIVQSPTIGVIMADLILEGGTKYDISEIEADRFSDMPEMKDRVIIKEITYKAHADYYGKVHHIPVTE